MQRAARCCNVPPGVATCRPVLQRAARCCTVLQSQIDSLALQLENAMGTRNDLVGEIEALQARLERGQKAYLDLQQSITNMAHPAPTKAGEVAELERQNALLRGELDRLAHELRDATSRLAETAGIENQLRSGLTERNGLYEKVSSPATSAPGLGSGLPHLRRDWARACHICAGTGLAPATSAQ